MKLQNETKPQNLQDILNRNWKHFITDNNPQCSRGGSGSLLDGIPRLGVCMYRYEGNGCAIGCMLPDLVVESIPDMFLDKNIVSVFEEVPSVRAWFSTAFRNGVTVDHLKTLQWYHDQYFFQLKELLTEFCQKHDLELPSEAIST